MNSKDFGYWLRRHRHAQRTIWVALLAMAATPALADDPSVLPITIGGGIRAGFINTSSSASDGDSNDFSLYSARLYLNGGVTEQVKFTLDTEYTGDPPGGDNRVQVLDAIARFEFSPGFNLWAGRFLPPSDRANLYGPYYADNWSVYTDGIQDGYPATYGGRDNGVAYWGDFEKFKVSIGAFDVPGTTNSSKVVGAARIQYDFWDAEPGYYLNGTYYGEKDILAVGIATQTVGGHTASTGDLMIEKKLSNDGVLSLEGEVSRYRGFGGYDPAYANSNGWYGLVAYLFPQHIGIGKFQLLGKYAEAKFERGLVSSDLSYQQKTSEVDLNYVIKNFNARVGLFYKRTTFDQMHEDFSQVGIGVQLQL